MWVGEMCTVFLFVFTSCSLFASCFPGNSRVTALENSRVHPDAEVEHLETGATNKANGGGGGLALRREVAVVCLTSLKYSQL
jgi:hypothetical protein